MSKLFSDRQLFRFAGLFTLGALLLAVAYVGSLPLSGNFHTVIAGELYRSGQITPEQLQSYVAKYGIKTIVNLRGSNPKDAWYATEIAQSRDLHIDHVDFRLSARQELGVERAARLMSILRTARKPILIHCLAGADRSGLASALYLTIVKRMCPELGAAQLSFRFGHISLPFIPEYAMDRSFEKLERNFAQSKANNRSDATNMSCNEMLRLFVI